MTDDEFEQLVKKGYTEIGIEPTGGYFLGKSPSTGKCYGCALAAAAVANAKENNNEIYNDIVGTLNKFDECCKALPGLNYIKAAGIVNGFDGTNQQNFKHGNYSDGYRLGQKLRNKYILRNG